MGKRFASFLSLFGVCTLLESKLLKIIYILNVNISMTVGRIFTKKYIFILGFFSKTGKVRVICGSAPLAPISIWSAYDNQNITVYALLYRYSVCAVDVSCVWLRVTMNGRHGMQTRAWDICAGCLGLYDYDDRQADVCNKCDLTRQPTNQRTGVYLRDQKQRYTCYTKQPFDDFTQRQTE